MAGVKGSASGAEKANVEKPLPGGNRTAVGAVPAPPGTGHGARPGGSVRAAGRRFAMDPEAREGRAAERERFLRTSLPVRRLAVIL